MARRFKDIERGAELAAEFDALQLWRKKTRAEKAAAYTAVKKTDANRVKTERQKAFIQPFGATKAGIYFETRVPAPTQTGEGTGALITVITALTTGRFVTVAPQGATDTVIEMTKFQFAKVRASLRTGTTPEANAVSRFTNRPYKRWRTDSMSSSFGQSATDTDYFAAVKAMKANTAYTTFVAAVGSNIGFTPEGS